MDHPFRRRYAAAAVLAAGAILLAGCSSSGSSAKASGSQPYAGQSLTVETYTAVPEFDFYKSLLPKFEAQTGIKVNWVEQPVDTMDTKIPLQLKAKDTGLDVFFTGSENITSYIGSNGVQPFDSYISNTKDTRPPGTSRTSPRTSRRPASRAARPTASPPTPAARCSTTTPRCSSRPGSRRRQDAGRAAERREEADHVAACRVLRPR